MKTKLKAVAFAQKAGCVTVLAHGGLKRVISRILDGEEIGTLFLTRGRLRNRTRWILAATPKGRLTIDEGATEALEHRKSLLPSGLVKVEGEFAKGDVILINDRFKAIAGSSSTDMRKIIGCHSNEIKKILGDAKRDVISRSGDIVCIDQ
jgi:glutamate 5-kinase